MFAVCNYNIDYAVGRRSGVQIIRFKRGRVMVPRRYMRTSISKLVEFSGDGGDKNKIKKMLIADLNINFMDIKNKQKSDFNGGNIVTLAIINSNLSRLDSKHRFVLLKVIKDFCSQYYFQTNYNDCAPRGR